MNIDAVAATSVAAIAVVNDAAVAAISVVAVAVVCYIIRLRWSVALPQSGRIEWIFVLFGKISPKVGQITKINTTN